MRDRDRRQRPARSDRPLSGRGRPCVPRVGTDLNEGGTQETFPERISWRARTRPRSSSPPAHRSGWQRLPRRVDRDLWPLARAVCRSQAGALRRSSAALSPRRPAACSPRTITVGCIHRRAARACRKGATDPGLDALYFQFGRYLLIASSRPGICRPTCRGSGTTVEPAVGRRLPPQHQSADELLAGRGDQPRRAARAAVRFLESLREPGRAPRGSTTARAASSPITSPISGGSRRPATCRARACGRPAPRGWRSTSGSTTCSGRIARFCSAPIR